MNWYCKIYVQAQMDHKQLIELVAQKLHGNANFNTIESKELECYIDENEESDILKAKEFPDGFLYFKYLLEIYPTESFVLHGYIVEISELLNWLWSSGYPAVASCDFEEKLPLKGGYNNAIVPWIVLD